MNKHHTIIGKISRDATTSHPYLFSPPDKRIEIVQFKAIQEQLFKYCPMYD